MPNASKAMNAADVTIDGEPHTVQWEPQLGMHCPICGSQLDPTDLGCLVGHGGPVEFKSLPDPGSTATPHTNSDGETITGAAVGGGVAIFEPLMNNPRLHVLGGEQVRVRDVLAAIHSALVGPVAEEVTELYDEALAAGVLPDVRVLADAVQAVGVLVDQFSAMFPVFDPNAGGEGWAGDDGSEVS